MIKLINVWGPASDETCGYNVEIDKPYTFGEFVREVLESEQNEWGYFEALHNGQGWARPFFKVEYRYGKLLGELPENIANLRIVEAISSGGWSRMDYSLKVE